MRKDFLEELPAPLAWLLVGLSFVWRRRRPFFNALFLRRFRIAVVSGYVAFGDKMIDLATIAPQFRRRLWERWRRPGLLTRVRILESRIN